MSDTLEEVVRRYAAQGYCHCGSRFEDHTRPCPPLGEAPCGACRGSGQVGGGGGAPATGGSAPRTCGVCEGRGW